MAKVPIRGARRARRTTSTGPQHSHLILVLQQALEDCYRYQHFAADAQGRGDGELVDFVTELAESDRDIAERARRMLLARLGSES